MRLRVIAHGLSTLPLGQKVSVLDNINQRWHGWAKNNVRCYDLKVRRKSDPTLGYRFTGVLVHQLIEGRGLRLERWCDERTVAFHEIPLNPSDDLIASLARTNPMIAVEIHFDGDQPPILEAWFDGATTETLNPVKRQRSARIAR